MLAYGRKFSRTKGNSIFPKRNFSRKRVPLSANRPAKAGHPRPAWENIRRRKKNERRLEIPDSFQFWEILLHHNF
jgi:hypothetical protein